MSHSEELEQILNRIEKGQQTDEDINVLHQRLLAGDRQIAIQLGKYNVNIGQGHDIQIGDRNYYTWSDEAIQAVVEVVQKGSVVAVVNAKGNATIDQSHQVIYNYYNYYREEVKAIPVDATEETDDLPCPYRGLFSFSPEDANYFFGRDIFIEELYQATQTRNFIPVLGASGSGKSSVVLAGLVPKLVEAGHWQFTHFRPGKDPFHALAQALVPLYVPNLDVTDRMAQARKLAGYFQDCTVLLSDVFATIQQNHSHDRILLIADQFEELYTGCHDEQTRRQFLDTLLHTFRSFAEQSSLSAVLVATMRADFLGNVLSYPPLADVLRDRDVKIRSMNSEELREVIEQPAQKLGVSFESGLVERILNDVEKEPGNLPLLEFALTELWKKRTRKQLTHKAYEEIGEVSGALTRYADEKYRQLKLEEQNQVHRIFVQLVRPGEGTEDTRRVATKAELNGTNWNLVKKLADARLVVTSRTVITREQEDNSEQETVEVIHEALIRNWGQLQGWMQTDREFRGWQERLRAAMRHWEEMQRDKGLLLRGAALVQAQEQLKERREELSQAEQEFIRLSQKYQQRQRQLLIGLITAGFVAISGVAILQWRNIVVLDQITQIGDLEYRLLRGEESLDVQLGVLKLEQQANEAILDTQIQATNLLQKIVDWQGEKEVNSLEGHQEPVYGVAFSPDRELLASASADNTVKLWKSDGTLVKTLEGHKGTVYGVTFSRDGKLIASASADKTVKLWESDGTFVRDLKADQDWVYDIAFSPDGKLIASASGNTVKLWKPDGRRVEILKGHLAPVYDVAFSPDGNLIASTSADNTVKLWKLDGTEPTTLKGHQSDVYTVAFSPDGKLIASGSYDSKVKLWTSDGTELRTLEGHQDRIYGVAFSPDGKLIASASLDNTVKLWKSDGTLENTLEGHQDSVANVAFSPDGKLIASAGFDDTVKLWELDATLVKTLERHQDFVYGVAFSPDGKWIASASFDDTVKLWNPDGTFVRTLKGHEGNVYDVAFSRDGNLIASASEDKTVKLWNPDGTFVRTLEGHQNYVISVAFSRDGKLIASASADKTVKLWKLDGTLVKTLEGHRNYVNAVAFSRDGKWIVSASLDNTVKLWKLDGTWVRTLEGHQGYVYDVAFSPDGNLIASASRDKTVKLWKFERDELLKHACQWVGGYLKNNANVSQDERRLCGVEASATAFFLQGEQLAAEGNIDKAVSAFQKAVKLDSNFSLSSAAASLVLMGKRLIEDDKFDEAILAYNQAQSLDSKLEISASDWNKLCWEGSVNEQAKKVMFACEKAVELAPNNVWIRKSRGLARALTGDVDGAIEDFKALIAWTDNEEDKAQLQRWVESLKKGENSFTSEELERLR